MPAMFPKFKIIHTDGSEVICDGSSSDIVHFEDHFDKPGFVIFDEMRVKYLWFFAYMAESRTVENIAAFDDWINTVDSVEQIGDASENPPSAPTPTPSP